MLNAAASNHYATVPPEPWGRRLLRAREDVAGLNLDEAAATAGHYVMTTASTISRLERLPTEPTGPRQRSRRQLAYVLCAYVYNVDPADFGLSSEDVPPNLRNPKLRDGNEAGDQHSSGSGWFASSRVVQMHHRAHAA